jgi:hypothetical protein
MLISIYLYAHCQEIDLPEDSKNARKEVNFLQDTRYIGKNKS